jgi:hypothetical protein
MYKSIEQVSKQICDKLVNLSFNNFIKMMKIVDIDYNTHNQDDLIWIKQQYDLIKNYCQMMKANNYIVTQEYKYSDDNSEGRLFVNNPNGGIQRINKYIRGCLTENIYTDVDMQNCHISVLRYLCNRHNLEHNKLYMFCMNREEYYISLMNELKCNRDIVKMLFIKSINSCKKVGFTFINGKRKQIKNKFYIEFDNEIKQIQKLLVNLYPELKQKLFDKGKYENVEGKLVNYLLCKYENDILTLVRNNIQDIDMNVLMFDGFMTKTNINKSTLDNLNSLTSNYNIKWAIKQHDTTLKEYILNLNNKTYIMFFSGTNIIELAKSIYNDFLKEKLFTSEKQHWFRNDKLYTNDNKEIKRCLFKFITSNDVFIIDNNEYKSVNLSKRTIDDLINSIMELCDDIPNFFNTIWEDSKHKIYFNNGYYDFKTNEFITDTSMFKTTQLISYNLNLESNPNHREYIFKNIFYPIFGINDINTDNERLQLLESFLYRIARFIGGNIEDKIWICLQGLRNCGKSVMADFLKNTFQCYVKSTQSGNFLYKENNSSDEEKAYSWAISLIYSRIAITQEITLSKNKFIDGNKIKKFTSGGDTLTGRTNFKEIIDFKMQCGLMVCCNDFPKAKPTDCLDTCEEYVMTSKFIKKNEIKDDMKLNNINYYPRNDNIKDIIMKQELINELVLIIIDYSKRNNIIYPEKILKDNKENNEDIDDTSRFKELFSQGNIETDFISNKELTKILEENDICISMKMFKIKIKGLFNVKNDTFNNKRGIKGIIANYI